MIEKQTAEFGSLVDTWVSAGVQPTSEVLRSVAQSLANFFAVAPDEVAILSISIKHKHLKFVIPEKLAAVGSIPLSSTTALAARTARERRPEVVNNFLTSRHVSVFEGVPLGRRPGESIQKIMSAPIMDGTQVRGVIQISRKGRTAMEAGSDFTQKDLRVLTSLSPILDRFLKLCLSG